MRNIPYMFIGFKLFPSLSSLPPSLLSLPSSLPPPPFFPSLSFQAAGKYRQQGRNYIVEDGDIVFFKFNAGAGLTSAKKK